MNYKLILIIVALAVVALAAWYFYTNYYAPSPTIQPTTVQPQGTGTLSAGDKTSDITSDLNKIPDDSVATQQLNSLNSSIQSF